MLSLAEKGESATKKKKMETIDLIGKHSPFPKAGVPSLFKQWQAGNTNQERVHNKLIIRLVLYQCVRL